MIQNASHAHKNQTLSAKLLIQKCRLQSPPLSFSFHLSSNSNTKLTGMRDNTENTGIGRGYTAKYALTNLSTLSPWLLLAFFNRLLRSFSHASRCIASRCCSGFRTYPPSLAPAFPAAPPTLPAPIHEVPARSRTGIGEVVFEVVFESGEGVGSVGEGDMEAVETPGTKPRAAAAAIICAEGGVWSMQSRRMIMEGSRSWNYIRQQSFQTLHTKRRETYAT
jgi:hypothetical protein